MKRARWCRWFGCKLVVVRAGWPLKDQWFVRCDRKHCGVSTVTVDGYPWDVQDDTEPKLT